MLIISIPIRVEGFLKNNRKGAVFFTKYFAHLLSKIRSCLPVGLLKKLNTYHNEWNGYVWQSQYYDLD